MAIFKDHFEAADFIDCNEKMDHAIVSNVRYTEIHRVEDILNDKDINDSSYLEELACEFLGLDTYGKKISELHNMLKTLGY